MKIDGAFILSAGLGTRMGELGKIIPKPAFPLFNKSIIEILVLQLKELGLERVFVNTHHQAEYLNNHLKKINCDVVTLHEKALLGSGGAFYNLKKNYPELKNILSINADMIFNLVKSDIEHLKNIHFEKKSEVTLQGLKVEPTKALNRLYVENSQLKGIITYPNSAVDNHSYTYSGICILDLDKLDKKFQNIESSFFDSVACYKKKEVHVNLPDKIDYFDLGTLENYIDSIKSIKKDKNSFIRSYFSAENLTAPGTDMRYENEKVKVTLVGNDLKFKLK